MIKNYLLITLRNFIRNRNYTVINVLGLSIGITSCIIIFLLITYELSFDKFNSKYDHIYRIVQDKQSSGDTENSSTVPYPVTKAFRHDFPEVPLITEVHYNDGEVVKVGTQKYRVEKILFADSLFFEVFDFKVLSGNPKADLAEPGKVFLTKSLAEKLLKGKDKGTLKLANKLELEVVGIIADPPATSHIQFSMIVSMPSLNEDFLGFELDNWNMTISGYSYIVLPEAISPSSLEERLVAFHKKYNNNGNDGSRNVFKVQPLSDIHFSKIYSSNPGNSSNAESSDLVVMGLLGIFILVIACINFINLATALAIKKSKEIGIRKTLGAKRSQLTAYFLGETFLITFLSVLISLCVTEWMLSWLNQFLEKSMDMNLLSNPMLLTFLFVLIVFATLLSGFYPAVILSGFNPIAVLKNKMAASGSSGAGVRKVLVIFQFTIAQILIIGTLIIADQMNYFRDKPLGFNKEAIVNIPLPDDKAELRESLRTRLEANANIKMITFSLGAPTSDNNFGTNYSLSEKGDTELHQIAVKPVDRHYLDVYGIKLKAGRWLTEGDEKASRITLPKAERKYVYVVNEAAVKKLGFSSPEEIIGKRITTGVGKIDAEVVGVVEDFHIASLHEEVMPVVLMNFSYFYADAGIKINTTQVQETIKFIEKNWSEIYPEYNFEYHFLDDKLAESYRSDERTFVLFKIFAGISIFIGCLGLYGLISFMANQKLKEVGIRKVMGASVGSIVALFSREFIKLIVIAFVIAAPVTWYFMREWLQGFAYRTSIQWTDFVIGMVATLIIALLTVSYRSIRSAVSNPADVLRTE